MQENALFRSPISPKAKRVLDIGCGDGTWAIDVADRFPELEVVGVDLYPPPQMWQPTNCTLEVDDVCKEWVWNGKFDLIHIRLLYGSFTEEQWTELYKQCYDNLNPGGWIEQIEPDLEFRSDDNTLPSSSLLAGLHTLFYRLSKRIDRPLNTYYTMADSITKAGFVDLEELIYKLPVGTWPRQSLMREAGKLNEMQILKGFDGYVTHLLTKYGDPEPWSLEDAKKYVDSITEEAKIRHWHKYYQSRRVWAMKPLEEDKKRKRSDTSSGELMVPKRSRENSHS